MKATIDTHLERSEIISTLREAISHYDLIHKAWIFGSFARGDHHALSDIDIVVEADSKLSLMSLFGIQEQLSTLRFITVGLTPGFNLGFAMHADIHRLKPRVIKFQHTRSSQG